MRTQTSILAALVGVAIVSFTAGTSYGQSVSVLVNGAQQQPPLQLPVQTLDGSKPYVSLVDLVQALGGGTTRTPSRMRIDLDNTTAWIGLNDNRVNALTIFTVNNKMIASDDDVFIAVADCEAFFSKAFRRQVSLSSGADAPTGGGSLRERMQRRETTVDPAELLEPLPSNPRESRTTPPPPPESTTIRNILISPGHGGFDHGVEGPTGTLEKEITLNIALQVRDLLSADDSLNVQLIRENDIAVTTQQRGAQVVSNTPDLVVALHIGGLFSSETRGAAAFYTDNGAQSASSSSVFRRRATSHFTNSIDIAEIILDTLESDAEIPSRGMLSVPNLLLSKADCPAVLVEVGCLTNRQDEQRLMDASHQLAIAEAIIKSVRIYNTRDPREKSVTELNNNTRPSGNR